MYAASSGLPVHFLDERREPRQGIIAGVWPNGNRPPVYLILTVATDTQPSALYPRYAWQVYVSEAEVGYARLLHALPVLPAL